MFSKFSEEAQKVLLNAKKEGVQPYIPIHPKSYRKNGNMMMRHIIIFMISFQHLHHSILNHNYNKH